MEPEAEEHSGEERLHEPLDAAQLAAERQADDAALHAAAEALPIAGAVPALQQAETQALLETLPETQEHPALTAEQPQESLVLERKHPLAIRWMHWINFPVLFTMIWS